MQYGICITFIILKERIKKNQTHEGAQTLEFQFLSYKLDDKSSTGIRDMESASDIVSAIPLSTSQQ